MGKKQKLFQEVEDMRSDDESSAEGLAKPAVEVVTFTEVSKQVKNEHFGWKTFMSSKIKKEKPATKLEIADEEKDLKNDKELENLLKTTELITRYTSANLQGKERHEYIHSRLKQVGVKEKPLKVSLPIHLGMKAKAKERVSKQVENLKNLGIYTKTLHRETLSKEKALNKGRTSLSNIVTEKKRNVDKGIIGSIGKVKPGIMTVPKHVIDKINKTGKKKGNGKGRKSQRPLKL